VYRFNLLTTTAAGLSPDELQTVLLQRVVGLKLPGFARLSLLALGELTSWLDSFALAIAYYA
jgi:hypothetical protein